MVVLSGDVDKFKFPMQFIPIVVVQCAGSRTCSVVVVVFSGRAFVSVNHVLSMEEVPRTSAMVGHTHSPGGSFGVVDTHSSPVGKSRIVSNSSISKWGGETSKFGGPGEVESLHFVAPVQPFHTQPVELLKIVTRKGVKIENVVENREKPGVPDDNPIL